ncbi:MAG: transcriptional regulator [Kiloniellaceae bacterium]
MTLLLPVFRARALVLAAALLASGWTTPTAVAAELIMLERPGCGWCLRWNNEIAPAYPETSEGRLAPLRRVDVTGPWPADLAGLAGDRFTPTFILVENGVEVARLRGYPGEHFFWPLLGEMLGRLPAGETVTPQGSALGG